MITENNAEIFKLLKGLPHIVEVILYIKVKSVLIWNFLEDSQSFLALALEFQNRKLHKMTCSSQSRQKKTPPNSNNGSKKMVPRAKILLMPLRAY